jgi:transposase
MQAITTIGLDIAKSIFQIHGVDGDGAVVIRRFHLCRPLWP